MRERRCQSKREEGKRRRPFSRQEAENPRLAANGLWDVFSWGPPQGKVRTWPGEFQRPEPAAEEAQAKASLGLGLLLRAGRKAGCLNGTGW